jgi:hypothetical protein
MESYTLMEATRTWKKKLSRVRIDVYFDASCSSEVLFFLMLDD